MKRAEFPHCDSQVLHSPKVGCEYCNMYPEKQAERIDKLINFTGEYDYWKISCPSEERRSLNTIEKWYGNRVKPKEAELGPILQGVKEAFRKAEQRGPLLHSWIKQSDGYEGSFYYRCTNCQMTSYTESQYIPCPEIPKTLEDVIEVGKRHDISIRIEWPFHVWDSNNRCYNCGTQVKDTNDINIGECYIHFKPTHEQVYAIRDILDSSKVMRT